MHVKYYEAHQEQYETCDVSKEIYLEIKSKKGIFVA